MTKTHKRSTPSGSSRSQWWAMVLLSAILGAVSFAVAYSLTLWSRTGPSGNSSGMVWIPGGTFTMGSEDRDFPRSEQPAHEVRVDGFWMDETEVTNAEFRAFVEATGYVTTAEKKPVWEDLKKQLPPGTPKPPRRNL